MADIHFWFAEYVKEVEKLYGLVEKYKEAVSSSNERLIEILGRDCDAKGFRCKEVRKSLNLELKLERDKTVRNAMEARAKEYDEKCLEYIKEYNIHKSRNDKDRLFGEAVPSYSGTTEGKSNDTMLSDTQKVQDSTMESLGRTKRMIEITKEVGTSTVLRLIEQKEQIKTIETIIDETDTNLVRARKLARNFAIRMSTDRIIQGFAAINIVVLLGLILYVAISGKSLSPSTGDGSSISPMLSQSPTFRPTFRPTFQPTSSPSVESIFPLP